MKFSIPLIAAAALLTAPAAAADKTPPQPTEAQLKAAQDALSLIVSALNSKEIPQPTKNALFGCLYQNPLRKIGDAYAEVMAKNRQLDQKDPTQRLLVVAQICGAPVPSGKAGAGASGGKSGSEGR